MYCKHCGKEIADDSKFCRYCGTDLSEHDPIVSESTDNDADASSDNVSNFISSDETSSIEECNKIDSSQQEDNEPKNESYNDNKIMNVLGVLSGIFLWGIFAFFGLGLLVGGLCLVYMFIMMNMPNGMGITIFIIILAIVVYFVVKLIVNIIKSFRK